MGEVGEEVVMKVAEREGIEPADLKTRLYDVIDPDALEKLTSKYRDRRPPPPIQIEFTFLNYRVTVDGNGNVVVDE